MHTEELITKHDTQIDSIKESISELAIKITVLLTEHEHLNKKIEEICEAIKVVKDSQYFMKTTELEIKELNKRIEEIEKIVSVPPYTKFFIWLKNWYFLWLPAVAILGFFMDFLYKVPPAH